ncbi:MAG TPA: hypothetical protein VM536_13230 [Chloroflexia bacterium]|nr:hypothetical protein [Chloroflexia bacterium]
MKGGRPAGSLLAALLLGLALVACDEPNPPSPTPVLTATPVPTATPAATATSTPLPTSTPSPTPTEGPVRTPVGGAAGPEFMIALAALDAAPSYRYKLELALGPPEARYVLSGTGQYQAPASYDTNFNALGFSAEILTISNTTYVRSYSVWRQGPPDEATFPMGAPPNIGNVLGLLSYALGADLVGEGNDTLGDKPARHLRFTLPASGALVPAPPAPAPTGGDLWTDPTTHRPLRVVITFSHGAPPADNDGTLQIDFSDYGAPVVLTPPPTPVP